MQTNKKQGLLAGLLKPLVVSVGVAMLAILALSLTVGPKERAKLTLLTQSADAVIKESQGILNAHTRKAPIVLLDAKGVKLCFQHAAALADTCATSNPGMASARYENLNKLADAMIRHYMGKGYANPYNSENHMVIKGGSTKTSPARGMILLSAVDETSLRVRAFGRDRNMPAVDRMVHPSSSR